MMKEKPPPYILVEDRSQLSRVVERLENTTAIGVDLEADSLFHYQEKVCLLQVSTSVQNFLIDPLAIGDLSTLMPVFADPDIRKILHGADYDIRSLYRDFGIEVNALFDTQIAATFLGVKETGLASLLKDRFEITVEKKYQKKDWSERPLPKPMLDYATQDSYYLLPLARVLERELREKGWLFCVEEECERLTKVRSVPSNHSPLFLKFKGSGRLTPRDLTTLEAILQFRDEMARLLDRPPFKVFGSKQIMKMVKEKPRSLKDLEERRCLTPRQISGFGRPLLEKMDIALNLSEDKFLVYPKKTGRRGGLKVANRVKILKQWREQRALQLGIDPALVCPNSQVQALATVNPKTGADLAGISEMKDWQRELFGKEICSLLNPQ